MSGQTDPLGYGRQPEDGPLVSRKELDRRQAAKLNQSNNGMIEGKRKPWIPPHRSATTEA